MSKKNLTIIQAMGTVKLGTAIGPIYCEKIMY